MSGTDLASAANHGSVPLAVLRAMYVTMVRIRTFEERIAQLLEQQDIKCPTHLYTGQEAIATGVCFALRQDDYVFSNHRSHGHYLAKGGDSQRMMAEFLGKLTGCSHGRGGSMHLASKEAGLLISAPLVSGTIPIAVGTGFASKVRREERVSVAFFGDGALEEGTAHESMNMAATMRLPVLFVCENNFYASHMPLLARRAQDNLTQTAAAHGMPGFSVDGNDAVGVYQAAEEAVGRARGGAGPSFLECRTYRWHGHVGPSWDLDVGVKRADELKDWLPKDPVRRLGERLAAEGVGPEELELALKGAQQEVEEAITFALESPYPDEKDLLEHVFWRPDNHGEH